MGQFTGLLNELDNAETKSQPKMKAAKSEKRNPDKKAPTEKPLQSVESKPKGKNPGNGSQSAAPMRGKRSHPDYRQAPAFIRKDTYKAVKIALLNDDRGLDYSDLIQELLIAWLADRK